MDKAAAIQKDSYINFIHQLWYKKEKSETKQTIEVITTRMWAHAQRDGRPAEYRWRPLFNAAKFG